MDTEIVLIDLSSLAHPIWHMSQADPDPNKTSQATVARVRALASGKKHVAVCCDSGRSFRKDLTPSYKANRPESDAALQHQIRLACEQLQADGFPVWSVKPFEADDLIASAIARTILDGSELTALIVSADKDLLQLVGPRVRQMRPDNGNIIDAAGVKEKFGVTPAQVGEYLMLVGDASDNVKGANGIGPKKAAELLQVFGTLKEAYAELATHPTKFKPALATALREFEPRLAETRALIALRADVEVPVQELDNERVPKEVETFAEFKDEAAAPEPIPTAVPAPDVPAPKPVDPPAPTALARVPELVPAGAVPYELSLDPGNLQQAIRIAKDMYDSRLFSAYGTPQAVLSTIMLGRELGLPAIASLRQVHIIEGKHAMSADLMVSLILKSGLAEFFEPVEFNEQHAVWETKRKGARNTVRLEHTLDMAKTAGLVKDKSNWTKVPIDMLNARAKSRLARLIYPDVVGGLYTPDELADMRASQAA